MTTHQSLPAATGNLINPTVTPTYPSVIPDLSSNHPRLIRQSPRPVQQSSTTYPPVTPTCPTVMPDLIGHLNPKTMQKKGYIYFMTNQTNKVLYTGVTNSLKRRAREHFEGHGSVFTSKYNCNKLVYFEQLPSIEQAIAREKQLKHFKREWKNQLVDTLNPQWKDLSHSIIDDPDLI